MSRKANDHRRSVAVRLTTAAFGYFLFVFAAGFMLGALRTFWGAQQFGERLAELLEMPFMLAVTFYPAKWVMERLPEPRTLALTLSLGCIALVFMLTAEVITTIWIRHQSIGENLAGRDRIAGTVYLLMLLLFAFMPMLMNRRTKRETLAELRSSSPTMPSNSDRRMV